jgi:hypothetical protein
MAKPVDILSRLRRVLMRVLMSVVDTSLPPATDLELELVCQLRENFRTLQPAKDTNLLASEAAWINHSSRLSELVFDSDPREFLRWDVILETMFAASAEYIEEELRYLRRLSDWRSRWRKAIKESTVGRPFLSPLHPRSSSHLIHQAYHLAQFEEQTGVHLSHIDYIFEFGGGYGSMCRLFHNLGFKGRYVIFDLPHFSALQQFFLKSIGIRVATIQAAGAANAGVICTSDLEQLELVLSDRVEQHNSLFVATWSISETPIQLRESILPSVAEFSAFLIAYQQEYGEVNNRQFFSEWKDRMSKQVAWQEALIGHLPGSRYLFGKRQSLSAQRFAEVGNVSA